MSDIDAEAVVEAMAPSDENTTRTRDVVVSLVFSVFIPYYRTEHSPPDSQGIGHPYSKLSFMRQAEFVIICVRRPS
jgi:hypothetical protein